MTPIKRHQLERLQRLAVQIKGLIIEAECELQVKREMLSLRELYETKEYKEVERLSEMPFKLRQLVFKFGL